LKNKVIFLVEYLIKIASKVLTIKKNVVKHKYMKNKKK